MKNIKKVIAFLIIGANIAAFSAAQAEIKTYEGHGEYVMSDFEPPDVAKQRAKARAEQDAAE